MQAGRIMLRMIDKNVRAGESFALESTLSGRGYARLIPDWQARGYLVRLCFLSLTSPEMAVQRVRNRVREGGHNIEEDVIRRRFDAGHLNFRRLYRTIVDEWMLFDSAGDCPRLVEWGSKQDRSDDKSRELSEKTRRSILWRHDYSDATRGTQGAPTHDRGDWVGSHLEGRESRA